MGDQPGCPCSICADDPVRARRAARYRAQDTSEQARRLARTCVDCQHTEHPRAACGFRQEWPGETYECPCRRID